MDEDGAGGCDGARHVNRPASPASPASCLRAHSARCIVMDVTIYWRVLF